MESLENKRKSNKNLIGHSKEKKQDLSVRTEEKIKTGNTEEKNHVDEIGSMVEGEVAKETVLPSWMCESEAYEPNIDKDGFITKSAQAILGVLAKLKWNAGKDRRFSASPSLKLCYTFLFILLTACSKNYLFSLIMVAGNNSCTCKLSGIRNEANPFRNNWSSFIFYIHTVTGSIYGKSSDFTHNRNESISISYSYWNAVSRNSLE